MPYPARSFFVPKPYLVVGYKSNNKWKKIPVKKGEKTEKKRVYPIAILKYGLYNESMEWGKVEQSVSFSHNVGRR